MAKVRFSCPRCQAVMQTAEEKIGFDIACPQCNYQFTLIEPGSGDSRSDSDVRNAGPKEAGNRFSGNPSSGVDETQQWNHSPVRDTSPEKPANPYSSPVSSSTVIPPIYQGNAADAFCCPFCQTRHPPIWRSEISTAGWITFVVLLICTCFFFWVGFLIRDKYLICSVCKVRLPGRHSN